MKNWLIIEGNPTFGYRDWLPEDSGWPELDALHAEHMRLLDRRKEAERACGDVRRRHESEDQARRDTLKAAFLAGHEANDLPDFTPAEERQAEVDGAQEVWEAAVDAFAEFLRDAVATLAAHREEWFGALDERAAEGDRKRAEARRLAEEADAAASQIERLRIWVDRSTGGRLGHYPYGQLAAPPAEWLPQRPSEDERNRLRRERDAAPGIEVISA
jgi:hypothetical protein